LREQCLDLFDGTARKHDGEAARNPLAQKIAVDRDDQPVHAPIGDRPPALLALKCRKRSASLSFHGKCASYPLWICNFETFGSLGVLLFEQRHAPRFVQSVKLLLYRVDDIRGYLRNVGESVCQRFKVKPCPADENQLTRWLGTFDDILDAAQPIAGRKALCCWNRAVKAMLRSRFVRLAWPGGDHAQSVIDLHGVGVDDDAAALVGAGEREGRLAAGGGTRYQHRTPLAPHLDLLETFRAMPVLSLVANPADSELDTALAAAVVAKTGGELNWLNHSVACDIVEPTAPDALAQARDIIGSRRVDANLVPTEGRRKLLLVADMDSTMIEQECIDELAAALGIKDQVAEITDRAMRGELDFAQALDTRVALLRGLERSKIEEIRREAITLMPGGRALVQTMKAYGAYASLVSGGFTFFADYFARRIGFNEAVANVLEFEGDRLNGTVSKPIVDKNVKKNRLLQLAEERGLRPDQTLAVGDGANDLDMIGAAGFGVALHAKPVVAEAAGLRIDHGDLSALLYLQGYSDDEFVR
jgi:phosphoserine phosphatase